VVQIRIRSLAIFIVLTDRIVIKAHQEKGQTEVIGVELCYTRVKCVWSECGQVVRHSQSSRHLGIGSSQVQPKEGCATDTIVRGELLTQ